ncbi:thermonuclease family protein [Nitrosospira sp. Is2]|uniref:thermonuclease family protein n=1 Tax=Nitrosospira sp. Is2 TaxID=3080532 RepID=UPI003985A33C
MKNRYHPTVARVKCGGVDVNSEQVNRGMAWVYRRYTKDHDLYVLEHEAKEWENLGTLPTSWDVNLDMEAKIVAPLHDCSVIAYWAVLFLRSSHLRSSSARYDPIRVFRS